MIGISLVFHALEISRISTEVLKSQDLLKMDIFEKIPFSKYPMLTYEGKTLREFRNSS